MIRRKWKNYPTEVNLICILLLRSLYLGDFFRERQIYGERQKALKIYKSMEKDKKHWKFWWYFDDHKKFQQEFDEYWWESIEFLLNSHRNEWKSNSHWKEWESNSHWNFRCIFDCYFDNHRKYIEFVSKSRWLIGQLLENFQINLKF